MACSNIHPYMLLFKLEGYRSQVSEDPVFSVGRAAINANREGKFGGWMNLENRNV